MLRAQLAGFLATSLLFGSGESVAQTSDAGAKAPAALAAGLAGRWTGALGYRDYQTNKLFELPVATEIKAIGDGVTDVQISEFDEGSRQPPVWITTVRQHDRAANTVTSASFRAGRVAELQSDTVAVARFADGTHWTLVYTRTGMDDDKPADIRVTETRDGDDLLSLKEVRPAGSQAAWQFRNQTRLRRAAR